MAAQTELSAATTAKGIIDVYPGRREREPISLTTTRVKKVLGIDMGLDEIEQVLGSLGFVCHPIYRGEFSVDVPYWRTDIRLSDDVVEEIARIIGYDEIPTTLPSGTLPEQEADPMRALRERVTDILVGCGMQEIITYPLTSIEALREGVPAAEVTPLKVANRITPEQEYMRTSLRAGLLQTLSANEKREEGSIMLFEVGKVYLPEEGELPKEPFMVGAVLCSPRLNRSWHGESQTLDFFDVKGIVETLLQRLGAAATFEPTDEESFSRGRAARIVLGDAEAGIMGELHPRVAESFDITSRSVYLFEIDMDKLLPISLAPHAYRPVPRFPPTIRDLALVVESETPSRRVQDIIEQSPLAGEVTLFDVYTGDQVPRGKKSLAFRIAYQSPKRTLTDEEVNKEQERVLRQLADQLGATLRD